ncbi:DUF5683 domain-containing protein [Crocinitomix catalasitica]|uniref:DUF5683 domain-containing protein n=1 Tax=Crocinitomix catalasitica TaxID=184607 RepID=UPI0006864C91|nr:DUF5683 domain-containing protein [Crocinitomix catalasitica]
MTRYTVIFCLLYSITGFANPKDSVRLDTSYHHNLNRAALLSTIIPGSGQIYNEIGYRKYANKKHRAWWKTPIIYGGLGACAYYFYQNNQMANLIKKEYLFRELNDGEILDERLSHYEDQNALIEGYQYLNAQSQTVEVKGFNLYAKRRDIFIFAFIGVWGLNVLEAYVDAHFVSFDISEDLSFAWAPTLMAGNYPGLSLRLSLY